MKKQVFLSIALLAQALHAAAPVTVCPPVVQPVCAAQPVKLEPVAPVASPALVTAPVQTTTVQQTQVARPEARSSQCIVELHAGNKAQQNFTSVVKQAQKPVIVMFSAPWCGPCKQFKPVFEEVARSYGDKAVFVYVNGDDYKDVIREFSVGSYPTVKFFNKGTVAGTWRPQSRTPKYLKEDIAQHLGVTANY